MGSSSLFVSNISHCCVNIAGLSPKMYNIVEIWPQQLLIWLQQLLATYLFSLLNPRLKLHVLPM